MLLLRYPAVETGCAKAVNILWKKQGLGRLTGFDARGIFERLVSTLRSECMEAISFEDTGSASAGLGFD